MVLAISYLVIGLLAFTGQAARINPVRPQVVQDVAGIPGPPQPNMVVNQNHDIYAVLPIPTIVLPVQQGAVEKRKHFLETRAADAEAADSIEARSLTFPKLKSPRSSRITTRQPYGTKILGHSPFQPPKPFQVQPRGELNDVVEDFTDALISNGPAIHLVDPIVNVADVSVLDPFTQWLDSIAVYEEIARAQHLPSTTVTFTLTLDAIVTEIVPPPITVTETPLVTLTFTFAQLPTLPAMGSLPTSALPAAAGVLPAMPTVTGLPALPIAAPTTLEGLDPFVPSIPTVAGLPAASVPTLPADLQQGGQEVPAVAAVPFVPSIPTITGLPATSVPTLPTDLQQGGQEVPAVAAVPFVPSIPTVAGLPAASVPTLLADLQQVSQEVPAVAAVPEVPDISVPTPAANPDQLSPVMDSVPLDAAPSIIPENPGPQTIAGDFNDQTTLPVNPESISTPTLPAAVPDVLNVATTLPSTPEFVAPTTLPFKPSEIFNVATILPVEPQIPAAAPTLPAVVDDTSDIFNVATTIPIGFLTLPSPALQTDIPTSLPDSLAFDEMNPGPVIPTFASPNSENDNKDLSSADLPSIPSPDNITPSTPSVLDPTSLEPTSLDPSAAIPENCIGRTPGSSCAGNEGAWHCFCNGTSFQRCGSGVWSNVLHVASGATCEPGYFNNRLIMYISATGSVERVGGGRGRRGSGGRGGVMVRRTRVEVEAEV